MTYDTKVLLKVVTWVTAGTVNSALAAGSFHVGHTWPGVVFAVFAAVLYLVGAVLS